MDYFALAQLASATGDGNELSGDSIQRFGDLVAEQTRIIEREAMMKRHAPKPRELAKCGTGSLHGEQQYCFEKGWKEGVAAFRKMIRGRTE